MHSHPYVSAHRAQEAERHGEGNKSAIEEEDGDNVHAMEVAGDGRGDRGLPRTYPPISCNAAHKRRRSVARGSGVTQEADLELTLSAKVADQ